LASWTPWDRSLTVSWSGHRVAAMRRRNSTSSSSGTLMWKGRILLSSTAAAPTAGRQPAVVSVIAVPLIAAEDEPMGNPSIVRNQPLSYGVDTCSRPAKCRSRRAALAYAHGQPKWLVAAWQRVDWPAATPPGRWPDRGAGPCRTGPVEPGLSLQAAVSDAAGSALTGMSVMRHDRRCYQEIDECPEA
jgi:hypothetical protein